VTRPELAAAIRDLADEEKDECARAVRQSGPTARVPLLTEWKLTAMRYGR
jgi:hypothetical protein